MIQLAPIGLVLLALVSMGQSGGALVNQRVEGLRRVCSYEDRARGRRAPALQIMVGMAEPCPFHYPRRRPPSPVQVPAMATLEGETREGGQRICRYVYLGVRYGRPVRPGGYCPYTPNFTD